MRHFKTLALGLALAMPMAATAAPILLANGTLTGTTDKSGLTETLEDGVDHQNTLGGLGSGFAYAGGNTFLALPDRGPNATPYAGGDAVDNTQSYITRFQTMTMALTPSAPGSTLPFSLTPQLDSTTLFYSPTALNYGNVIGSGAPIENNANHFYFTGRSDGYAGTGSTNPANARFDPESIRVSNDGQSVFVSDEYGPYIRQFDRTSGALIKTFTLPANLAVTNLSAVGNNEITGNTSGRTSNKGMEGLALTPDGKTLVGIMQAALIQDANEAAPKGVKPANLLRIVTVDVATGATKEFAYKLTDGSGVSDIVALNDHQFLVDERDGKGLGDGSNASVKKAYVIDISGATDITNMDALQALNYAVTKSTSPFLDIALTLESTLGLTAAQVPSKIEGFSLGYDVDVNGTTMHTLWVTNDNDYLPDTSGQNQFYVFGYTDQDVAAAMASVPEPSSWALMIGGFALTGFAMRKRKARVHFA